MEINISIKVTRGKRQTAAKRRGAYSAMWAKQFVDDGKPEPSSDCIICQRCNSLLAHGKARRDNPEAKQFKLLLSDISHIKVMLTQLLILWNEKNQNK